MYIYTRMVCLVWMLIKIPFLAETFPIKRLSEFGTLREESDMKGLITLLFISIILVVFGQSYQTHYEDSQLQLQQDVPQLRDDIKAKRVEIDKSKNVRILMYSGYLEDMS